MITWRIAWPEDGAGADQTTDEGPVVVLDGSGSADPDGGDSLTYQWVQVGGTAVALSDPTSIAPSFVAPPGSDDLVFELVVADDDPVNALASAPESVAVHVLDVDVPSTCDLAVAQPGTLWPPDHEMVPVRIVGVSDPDPVYNDVSIAVVGLTQDEPVDGLRDGDSSPDAVIQAGEPEGESLPRAERSGLGNGRVYALAFVASDGFESCQGAVRVTVPHSRRSTAQDDGQIPTPRSSRGIIARILTHDLRGEVARADAPDSRRRTGGAATPRPAIDRGARAPETPADIHRSGEPRPVSCGARSPDAGLLLLRRAGPELARHEPDEDFLARLPPRGSAAARPVHRSPVRSARGAARAVRGPAPPPLAACKTLAPQGMKGSGMRWRHAGGQAILTLRAPAKSHRFERAWVLLSATYRAEVSIPDNLVELPRERAA